MGVTTYLLTGMILQVGDLLVEFLREKRRLGKPGAGKENSMTFQTKCFSVVSLKTYDFCRNLFSPFLFSSWLCCIVKLTFFQLTSKILSFQNSVQKNGETDSYQTFNGWNNNISLSWWVLHPEWNQSNPRLSHFGSVWDCVSKKTSQTKLNPKICLRYTLED